MRVAEINMTNYGAPGRIMLDIADSLRERHHNVMVCYPATRRNKMKEVEGSYLICNRFERNLGLLLSKAFGCDHLLFRRVTRRLVRQLERFRPDVVHLHILHGWYVNLPVLFSYLKKEGIPVVWTMHDCWALTGHCPYFDIVGCCKWETLCHDCPQFREYPEARVDRSRRMYRMKREAVADCSRLTVVTPSRWLAGIVSRSFLGGVRTVVINNGIDTGVFRPVESDFRSRIQGEGKFIILGVALDWSRRKGVDVFARLAADLDDRFKIVMVGTNEGVERMLPDRVITIRRTFDRKEMAAVYSEADLFLNPTREENFPTVNIEALACGTPVLTFNTGGSPEIIDENSGSVVAKDDYEAMKAEILRIAQERPFTAEACRSRALQFTREKMQEEYLSLLESEAGNAQSTL